MDAELISLNLKKKMKNMKKKNPMNNKKISATIRHQLFRNFCIHG